MTIVGHNRFCRGLALATQVVPWGKAQFRKLGSRVLANACHDNDAVDDTHITFKGSGLRFELLTEMPCCRQAPNLASRSMEWLKRTSFDTTHDTPLRDYLAESHHLEAGALTKPLQAELDIGIHAAARSPPADASLHDRSRRRPTRPGTTAARYPKTQRSEPAPQGGLR